MNSPTGFDFVNGKYTNIDPIKAMFNPAWFSQALHMSIAAFAATGFAVAGVHALMIVRKMNINFHKKAFRIAAVFGVVASILQPLSGDISAKMVAKRQPAKLAAMEAHFKTEEYSPLIIGGIPDVKNKKVNYALELPGLLSFMVHDNFKTPVKGLDQIPEKDQPPIAVTHYSFQLMVALGMLMMAIGVIYFIAPLKNAIGLINTGFCGYLYAATPIGFIAVEAGWTVTEVGRQPWIIQGIMRTKDAVTPMPGIGYSFYLFTAVYLTLKYCGYISAVQANKNGTQIYDTTNPCILKINIC
jgi:cytochrome d ubiquinol oxidase subunit I